MIEAAAIVRFGRFPCRRVYDVDVRSLAVLRGREWSLPGRTARCKASTRRARGVFVAAPGPDTAFLCLSGEMPGWLVGARPRDHEAPPDGDGGGGDGPAPPPPAPNGVDAERWAAADERERKRVVRRARD